MGLVDMVHLAHCHLGFDTYGVEMADLGHVCHRK